MAYSAFDDAARALSRRGVRFHTWQERDQLFLMLHRDGEHVPDFQVFLMTKIDQPALHVRLIVLRNVPPEKRERVVLALNQINPQLRWMKLILRETQNNVQLAYDFPPLDCNAGEFIDDLIESMTNIADECFPALMKIVWS